MTQDLHAFLRGTRREADVATPPVPIIRHALGVCQEVAIRARGLLRYDGPDTLPAVRMSSTELTQVLINVVTNAAQSLGAKSAGEGNVVVRAESVAGQIAFTVTDNGPGIPPEVLAKIGTPFFTTKDKGTGLGIAQCQRLVGKAGGQFRIASEPGKGTTVSFSIPVR